MEKKIEIVILRALAMLLLGAKYPDQEAASMAGKIAQEIAGLLKDGK